MRGPLRASRTMRAAPTSTRVRSRSVASSRASGTTVRTDSRVAAWAAPWARPSMAPPAPKPMACRLAHRPRTGTEARRGAGARSARRRARGLRESCLRRAGAEPRRTLLGRSGPAAPAGGRLGGPVGAVMAAVAPAPVAGAVDEHAAARRGGAEAEALPAALLDHAEKGDARSSGELVDERPRTYAVAKGPATLPGRQLRDRAGFARKGIQLFD